MVPQSPQGRLHGRKRSRRGFCFRLHGCCVSVRTRLSRTRAARLLTDPVDLLAKGISECLPALEAFRPHVVLFADTDAVPFGAFRIGALARGDVPPVLVVFAATRDVEASALAADVDEVLRANDPPALKRKRLARVLRELACRRREELARRMLECVDTVIATVDVTKEDAPVCYVNAAWERSTGRSRESVLGRSGRVLHGPATDPRTFDEILRLIETGEEGRVVVEDHVDGGTVSTYELTLAPVRNEPRRVTHYVGSRYDVSDRRRFASSSVATRTSRRSCAFGRDPWSRRSRRSRHVASSWRPSWTR